MSTPVAGRTASGDFKHIAVGDDGSLVVQSQARREFVDLVVVRSQYKSLQTSSGNTGSLRLLRV